MARWFSWLECRPVTAEVEGSSPFRVAIFYAGIAQWQSTSLPRRGSRVRASFPAPQGYSSTGRVAVSKTVGCGFDSYCPCQEILTTQTKVYVFFNFARKSLFLKFTWISQHRKIKIGKRNLLQNTEIEILDCRFLLCRRLTIRNCQQLS